MKYIVTQILQDLILVFCNLWCNVMKHSLQFGKILKYLKWKARAYWNYAACPEMTSKWA